MDLSLFRIVYAWLDAFVPSESIRKGNIRLPLNVASSNNRYQPM